jgi:hypothetical protein
MEPKRPAARRAVWFPVRRRARKKSVCGVDKPGINKVLKNRVGRIRILQGYNAAVQIEDIANIGAVIILGTKWGHIADLLADAVFFFIRFITKQRDKTR